MAARHTEEFALALPVGLLAMPTLGAGSAGVPRVDFDHGDAGERRLVRQEGVELREGPTREPIPCVPASGRNPLANPRQFFDGDSARGALGGLDDRLADHVVLVTAEASLLDGDSLQFLLGSFRVPLLESLPLEVVLPPDILDWLTGVLGPVGIRGDVGDAQVNPKEVPGINRGRFGHVDRAEQVELAPAIDEVGLPLDSSLPFPLVIAADEGDSEPSGQGPQAHLSQPLETQDSLVIADRRVSLEDGTLRLVSLEALDRLGDRANRHLARQPKPLPDFVVGEPVKCHLPEDPRLETDLRGERRGFVEPLHRADQVRLLNCRREQLQLDREFHVYRVAEYILTVKEGG